MNAFLFTILLAALPARGQAEQEQASVPAPETPRVHEVGASFVLTRVKYPVPVATANGLVVVVPGDTTSVFAPGMEVVYARLLKRIVPGSAERGKLVADIRLELPVSWSPHIDRTEGVAPPAFSVLSVTPRIALRIPADRRAQVLVAFGGGVSHYSEQRRSGTVQSTAGVYHVAVGGHFRVRNNMILRIQYGGTSLAETLWLERGSLASSDLRIGALVPF